MIRSIEELRREQAEVLASYRASRVSQGSVALLPRQGNLLSYALYGRVASVVAADADYGPHLMVMRQAWSGTPPTVTDSTTSEVRCYPAPNRVLSDYVVDEHVRVVTAHGAMVAEKLA